MGNMATILSVRAAINRYGRRRVDVLLIVDVVGRAYRGIFSRTRSSIRSGTRGVEFCFPKLSTVLVNLNPTGFVGSKAELRW